MTLESQKDPQHSPVTFLENLDGLSDIFGIDNPTNNLKLLWVTNKGRLSTLKSNEEGYTTTVLWDEPGDNFWKVTYRDPLAFIGTAKGDIHVWDTQANAKLITLKGHSAGIIALSFLHDGTLVSISEDGETRFWSYF